MTVGSAYSWSVLQCSPGKFCCRAASDTTNCCGNDKNVISTSHIGTLLLPGSSSVVNTTFNYTTNAPTTANNPSTTNSSCTQNTTTLSNLSCPADHSVVVGGTVGGILGAALIGSLVALLLTVRSRQKYKTNLGATSAALATMETNAANEKARLQDQYARNHYSQASTQYSYGQSYGKPMSYNVTELPDSRHGLNELQERSSGRSELTAEQGDAAPSYTTTK